MERAHIWVMGGDGRQSILARLLREDGHRVHTLGLGEEQEGAPDLAELGQAHCVILPLPAQQPAGWVYTPQSSWKLPVEGVLEGMRPGQLLLGGMLSADLVDRARQHRLRVADYYAREELTLLNAIPTAEGAIGLAMERMPTTIHNSRIWILGFGRVGQALAPRLAALGARVCILARSPAQRALARSMGLEAEPIRGMGEWLHCPHLVVNTVPVPLLGVEELSALREGAWVLDLASAPGGVDRQAAQALGVPVVWARGLPGKVAPHTAAEYLKDTVYHMMEELGV